MAAAGPATPAVGRGTGRSMLPDLEQRARDVAPYLLGCVLRVEGCAGRIVEVEAYEGANDAASHARAGPTPRSGVMFGPPGRLYVYLIYGRYHCANVVCGPAGDGGAVLIRAVAPLDGEDVMWARRPKAHRRTDLCSGPGKLCQALAIDRRDDGVDLLSPGRVSLLPPLPGLPPPRVLCGPRVGISVATRRRWRFALADEPDVSRPRAGLQAWLPDPGSTPLSPSSLTE